MYILSTIASGWVLHHGVFINITMFGHYTKCDLTDIPRVQKYELTEWEVLPKIY